MRGPRTVGSGALAMALVFLNTTRAFADPNVQQINAAVKACVAVTNANDDRPPDPHNWHFDAYYNAATGKVENNLEYVFQQRFLFVFQKCMAERGFPLGKKTESTDGTSREARQLTGFWYGEVDLLLGPLAVAPDFPSASQHARRS